MTNVALIVLDTLRYDSFEKHFDWLPGERFENAFSPSHYTVPAHGGMFSGYYPSEVGTHAKSEDLDFDGPVLAETLNDFGYTTRGFTANVLLSPWNNWDRGFDEYKLGWRARAASPDTFNWSDELSTLSEKSRLERYVWSVTRCLLSDCATIPSLEVAWHLKRTEHDGAPEALDYVSETSFQEDEFLFMNLMEAHLPYRPPSEYRTTDLSSFEDTSQSVLGGDTDCGLLKQAYDDCVRYLSDMYEQLFYSLTEDFDYIVTVADHGELFGEHNARAHWHGVYPELTHVPFSIWNGESDTQYRSETVSLIDLHQTILSMVGDEDSVPSRGRDVCSIFDEKRWLTESNGLRPSRVEALKRDGFSSEEISKYDTPLYGLADPDYYAWQTPDSLNIRGSGDAENIEDEIERIVSSLDRRQNNDSKSRVNESAQSQLEDLGYL
ncbi:sulfatase-like hydrolase/transferase [Halosegnis rubeus]|uniref:Sulfatase-like hydrolase/transferase n=1 Tax=Halosegnis rubeus TaxID=2212850 RepID=A0A5N5U8C5_9EURY|nr:sulfatase-like hydrolase/transferase [Halosegnis rubeus]KAB7514669.1 sulfatase-like hydrolase/transferase [Halosegnis rubeus]